MPPSDSFVYVPSKNFCVNGGPWGGDRGPEAFMFPSKRDAPMRYGNYLKQVLKPDAEAVGLDGITHQMLRRSFSTMALDSGASRKDVQGQMRHTEARMSLYFGKVIPGSAKEELKAGRSDEDTKIEEQGRDSKRPEAKDVRQR